MIVNILIITTFILIIGYIVFKTIINEFRNFLYIKYYDSYTKLLEYYCISSYEIFYKKHIITYTLENFTIDNQMLETLERSFVKLTISLMGIRNERLFISYFGGEQYLIDNILMFIRNKIDHDNVVNYAKSLNQQDTESKDIIKERDLKDVFSDDEQ